MEVLRVFFLLLLSLLLLLRLVAYILRSCVLVSLWFFCKHTREFGFSGAGGRSFFYYDVHFFLFVLTSCCTWLVMNFCTGVRVAAAADDLWSL